MEDRKHYWEDVCIPRNEFIKEHIHLLHLLRHGDRTQLLAEAKSQEAELKGKTGGSRAAGYIKKLIAMYKDGLEVFDTKAYLPDGAARVTVWDSITPTALLSKRDGSLLLGQNGYVALYNTYQDHTDSYRMLYYTNHADLGNQNVTSILKKLSTVVIGGTNQTVTFKWGFDFKTNYLSDNATIPEQDVYYYGIAEYGANATTIAYYSDGVAIQTLTVSN